ncbi:DUF58 domain-containing protein [Agrococcus carbonis]|uniref:Uncharacterized conserved protein, DUF58 family, contains vWF domain n=1 Tax=Agrococcus carbonis TaxID=684552 RepID=A0A1H1PMT8_9MICO|nr:DUF58 domain-containing protein [Agrococcus carbonis]SDS12420.1 Uncharacterized conserved protein, DUF58 family, contains vWF domain [Agrococcus carbonis]
MLGVLALLIGALTGRAELAALGVAPMIMSAAAAERRPAGSLSVQLQPPTSTAAGSGVRSAVTIVAPLGAHAARVRASGPGTRPTERLVRLVPGEARTLPLRTASPRTGERWVFQVDVLGLAAQQGAVSDVVTVGPTAALVLPQPRRLGALPLPPRLQGLVGPHAARRIGDGTELHDVSLFAPGDRLRRIDWRASARRGTVAGELRDLYVRRTQSTADATVVLVIDSRDEVGPDVGTWAGGRDVHPNDATSLDIAREAAASLADSYLRQGDRVGLEDLGLRQRPVRPAGGRRHLDRIIRRLALAAPERTAPRARVRAPQVPSGALVIILSTFLDDEAMAVALQWRRTGHRVVAVDVLPTARGAEVTSRTAMAYRLVALRRDDRLEALRRAGASVVRWDDDRPEPVGARAALELLSRDRQRAPR